jgi:hypothetical protein
MPELIQPAANAAPAQAHVDNSQAPPQVPEKYAGKTIDQVIAMHQEAERALSSRTQAQPAQPATPQPNGQPTRIPEQRAPFADRMRPFAEEYVANSGKLSDQSYQKLASQGYEREAVDMGLSGMVAQGRLAEMQAQQSVGGEQTWQAMMGWARDNLTQQERQQFNTCTDPGMFQTLVAGLHARWRGAVGGDPAMRVVGNQAAAHTSGYRDRDDYQRAMRETDKAGNLKYQMDPAYRADVQARLAASPWVVEQAERSGGWNDPLVRPRVS